MFTSFSRMFGYFDSPFFYGYRPRYYVYRPRVSMFDRYIANIASHLADLLDEVPAKQQHSLEFEKKKHALEMAMRRDAQDHSETKAKAEAAAKSLYGSDEAPSASPKPSKKAPVLRRGYFFESRSSFNGKDYVEEHRERVTDEDGGVHIKTRRRLGDRWYEQETHTDNEGKVSSKETWHNVPSEAIESFKSEWSSKHGLKYESAPPAEPSESADPVEAIQPADPSQPTELSEPSEPSEVPACDGEAGCPQGA